MRLGNLARDEIMAIMLDPESLWAEAEQRARESAAIIHIDLRRRR